MRRIAPLIVVLALLAAACGDDDGATTTIPGATTTTSGSGSTAATTPGGPAGIDSDLQALLDTFADTPLRLTYTLGEGDDATTVVMSQDPTSDPERTSLLSDGTLLISDGTETIFCEVDGGECFATPAFGSGNLLDSILGPVVGGFVLAAGAADIPGVSIEFSSDVVAGRDGLCYSISPPAGADTDSLYQCLDTELGFTLLIEATSVGGTPERILTLVEFSTPTEVDFTPTGPVTTAP